ncbi:MAG TPA: type II toxin-antitoxin system RelE/ParE family toxin [Gemmataceae bacterium]|nr:type II toxin-antitoxin system RelE/ParE family toxin [Gemmataceae bacterium]
MSSDSALPLQVTFTPEFKRNLRQLAKKYRRIKSDLQPILDQLASGTKPGDQVPRVRYEVFKVRAKNSDALKGKSSGYRLIYYVKTESEVVLVTVYSKTEQADIAPEEIRQIILDLETTTPPDPSPEQQANEAPSESDE